MNLTTHTLVRLNTRDKDIRIRELTFLEYKQFCKSLYSHDSLSELVNLFDKIIQQTTDIDFTPNILEKIVLVIFIREITLGKQITLTSNNHSTTLTTDFILDKINKKVEPKTLDAENVVYTVHLPNSFANTKTTQVSFIQSCITSAIINDNYNIDLQSLNDNEREELLSHLPPIPVTEIYKNIISSYSNFSFTIKLDKEYMIQLFDGTFIFFLKHIFDQHLQNILSMEYDLRRHLNFNGYDFETTPYPECIVLLDKYIQETKAQEKQRHD